jgi:hypothetical protein
MTDITINLVVEDALSEAVAREILRQSGRSFVIGRPLNRRGSGNIKNIISGLNNAAKGTPYFVLTDLDNIECPLALISNWLPQQSRHPNLIFRVAVREVEAWVLAHRQAFSEFLGVPIHFIPNDVDSISDPKQFLVNLARKSKKRIIREAIVPATKSTAQIGKDYNGQLVGFVHQNWKIDEAKSCSESLTRAINKIANFEPI